MGVYGSFAMFLDKSNLRMYIHFMYEIEYYIRLTNAYVSGIREDLDLESSAYIELMPSWALVLMCICQRFPYDVCADKLTCIVAHRRRCLVL